MGGTLIPDHFVLQKTTTNDLVIASLAWGFTLGIGWVTTWTAIKQTMSAKRRLGWGFLANPYIIMIWGEILASCGFGVMSYLYLFGIMKPSFEYYFFILTLWVIQVQFLLQIIVNRCAILITDRRVIWRVKWGVALIITLINISVYCIWIPARLQVAPIFIHINNIWDRIEKVIYLLVDFALNLLFIRTVKQNLVELGLTKYNGLVRFNIFIIGFSLGMDVLIIGMMSLENTFVYMQFHPLAYMVKLNIEMSMASLIAKIARTSEPGATSDSYSATRSHTFGARTEGGGATVTRTRNEDTDNANRAWPTVTTTIEMNSMKASEGDDKSQKANFQDTATLIDQGAPYAVRVQALKRDGRVTTTTTTRREGSVSSRDSSGIETEQ